MGHLASANRFGVVSLLAAIQFNISHKSQLIIPELGRFRCSLPASKFLFKYVQWLILQHRLLVSVEDAKGSFTDDEIMAIEQG